MPNNWRTARYVESRKAADRFHLSRLSCLMRLLRNTRSMVTKWNSCKIHPSAICDTTLGRCTIAGILSHFLSKLLHISANMISTYMTKVDIPPIITAPAKTIDKDVNTHRRNHFVKGGLFLFQTILFCTMQEESADTESRKSSPPTVSCPLPPKPSVPSSSNIPRFPRFAAQTYKYFFTLETCSLSPTDLYSSPAFSDQPLVITSFCAVSQ